MLNEMRENEGVWDFSDDEETEKVSAFTYVETGEERSDETSEHPYMGLRTPHRGHHHMEMRTFVPFFVDVFIFGRRTKYLETMSKQASERVKRASRFENL